MRKIFLILAVFAGCFAGFSQSLDVKVGDVTYSFPASTVGDMIYSGGNSLTVMGKTFAISEIEGMDVVEEGIEDNTVLISYGNGGASVKVAGNVARYVTPAVDGGNVTVEQSDETGDDTCGEITYVLSGTSSAGSFALDGKYKATVELAGLTLTNPAGAALDIRDGKRIKLYLRENTETILADGASGEQKGCVSCKGYLEFRGKGSLSVAGNTAHGIYAKEYVEIKNATVTVTSAVKDGINCNQYFHI